MRSVVQAADSTSVFVRDATIETGTASSTSVEVPLGEIVFCCLKVKWTSDFPIVDGGTTTTGATTTTVTSGNDFPIVDGVTTTTRASTTTRPTTTTTRAGGATAPTDFPIYDGNQVTMAPINDPENDFPVVDDTEIIEDNTDNDTVTTTTVRTTTGIATVPVNPGTRPSKFLK